MTSDEKIERGFQAQSLLNNEFFKEVMGNLETRYVEAWKAAVTLEAREDAHKYIRLIEWFKDDIRTIATEGIVTKHRIDALKGEQQPTKLSEFIRG